MLTYKVCKKKMAFLFVEEGPGLDQGEKECILYF
jgi:hypothetical protein